MNRRFCLLWLAKSAKAVAWAKEYRFAPTEQAKQCGEIVFNFMLK